MKHVTMLVRAAFVATLLLGAAPAGAETLSVDPGADGCFDTIQDAIDAAEPGDIIDVYPGDYLESAPGKSVLGVGSYQFGLYVGPDQEGVTIRGVDGDGEPICRYRDVQAFITTDATNNFGPSGIFIEADGVTLEGLGIGVNVHDQNKTIEVIGDDFTLKACDVSDLGGSLYLNDWQFDEANDVSHLQKYRIEDNNFQDGISIDIASGAGYSGDVKDRVIQRNRFTTEHFWPAISFNGSNTGVPWFVYSVGGATIRDNTFVNTFSGNDATDLRTEGHIRARGDYDNDQFDWWGYLQENKYDQAYLTGPKPQFEVREYEYTKGYTFKHVRRIGALLAGEAAIAAQGDKTVARSNPN